MILAIKYLEPEFYHTIDSINRTGIPALYVDRTPKGVGSLAEAINRGVKLIPSSEPFVWVVTNITFEYSGIYHMLRQAMENDKDLAAICPCYKSDHEFLRKIKGSTGVLPVPFIEFTAAMFRTDLLKRVPLDEKMPYVGCDLDWSYQMRQNGWNLGSLKDVEVGHTYIRAARRHPITLKRFALRKAADDATIARLVEKYGENWQDIMQYHNGIAAK